MRPGGHNLGQRWYLRQVGKLHGWLHSGCKRFEKQWEAVSRLMKAHFDKDGSGSIPTDSGSIYLPDVRTLLF